METRSEAVVVSTETRGAKRAFGLGLAGLAAILAAAAALGAYCGADGAGGFPWRGFGLLAAIVAIPLPVFLGVAWMAGRGTFVLDREGARWSPRYGAARCIRWDEVERVCVRGGLTLYRGRTRILLHSGFVAASENRALGEYARQRLQERFDLPPAAGAAVPGVRRLLLLVVAIAAVYLTGLGVLSASEGWLGPYWKPAILGWMGLPMAAAVGAGAVLARRGASRSMRYPRELEREGGQGSP